ncbi:hypothetical protein TNCV_2283681 [Trichonephila clavipes]|nr:hypothetical protein TNCV_2283681 [Trichonephila clavipes]
MGVRSRAPFLSAPLVTINMLLYRNVNYVADRCSQMVMVTDSRPGCHEFKPSSADLSLFRAWAQKIYWSPWHWRIEIYNQIIWLSPAYPGLSGTPRALGTRLKHPVDNLSLKPSTTEDPPCSGAYAC